MSDENQPQSASEKAVFHILRRVSTDANFAWYMLGTEALRLCVLAAAEALGKPASEVREEVEQNAASNRDEPDVVGLRNIVDQLERLSDKEVAEIVEFDEEWQISRTEAVEELLRFAELGVEQLTVESLRNALEGSAMAVYRERGAT